MPRRSRQKPPKNPASQPQQPAQRMLRGYAFDPSLATQLETALVSGITYKVPWERLKPGPVGEYVEVVDYDPASECFCAPVDLDDPAILAQNGLQPSEGNPQFHQLVAFIPLREEVARNQARKGWDMPAGPLFKALRKRTEGRVVISDVTKAVPPRRPSPQSHPLSRAMRAASTRLRPPVLLMASER